MELMEFISGWDADENGMKAVFTEFKEQLESFKDAEIQFNARPGISFSMRGVKVPDTGRPLFVMVDVIDDDPSDRWLSVCFYGDSITDPDELGDLVPGGLLGQDGHCFDVDTPDAVGYVKSRIAEAYASK